MFEVGSIVHPIDDPSITYNRLRIPPTTDLIIEGERHPYDSDLIKVTIGNGQLMGAQLWIHKDLIQKEDVAERSDLSIWVNKDGSGTPFKEMTTDHLMNIVAMLHRKSGSKNAQRNKLVTLEKEILRRLKEQYEVQEGR